ncbi:hypothetical protein GWK47_039350 [Chionoecetes opilio]|uniref:Uncharacterized protein n=1 Tax=Chionoecetes opilio TaxID=41210 RepID=A0A8J5CY59_CHIOP|nr:hypothetical protein GWK47_039350 [Chionoecetes opilio]
MSSLAAMIDVPLRWGYFVTHDDVQWVRLRQIQDFPPDAASRPLSAMNAATAVKRCIVGGCGGCGGEVEASVESRRAAVSRRAAAATNRAAAAAADHVALKRTRASLFLGERLWRLLRRSLGETDTPDNERTSTALQVNGPAELTMDGAVLSFQRRVCECHIQFYCFYGSTHKTVLAYELHSHCYCTNWGLEFI